MKHNTDPIYPTNAPVNSVPRRTECPNRQAGYSVWICMCPQPGADLRKHLAGLWNGWLSPELLLDNKRLAADPATTDAQILERIRNCEREATRARFLGDESMSERNQKRIGVRKMKHVCEVNK